jgi:hypothetical protein
LPSLVEPQLVLRIQLLSRRRASVQKSSGRLVADVSHGGCNGDTWLLTFHNGTRLPRPRRGGDGGRTLWLSHLASQSHSAQHSNLSDLEEESRRVYNRGICIFLPCMIFVCINRYNYLDSLDFTSFVQCAYHGVDHARGRLVLPV